MIDFLIDFVDYFSDKPMAVIGVPIGLAAFAGGLFKLSKFLSKSLFVRSLMIATALLLVLGAALAAFASQRTDTENEASVENSITRTDVQIFLPGISYRKAFEKLTETSLPADCLKRSYVSARDDARLCALGGAVGGTVLDPCFTYEDAGVICLNSRDLVRGGEDPGTAIASVNYHDPPEFMTMNSLVPVENATESTKPWLMVLDMKDKEGNNYYCTPALIDNSLFKSDSFTCGSKFAEPFLISIGLDRLLQAEWISAIGKDQAYATLLDMDKDLWSISLAVPTENSLQRVNVLNAWF